MERPITPNLYSQIRGIDMGFHTTTKGMFKDFAFDINLDIATIITNLGIGQGSTLNFNMDHNSNIT
jgi:hypothetical protein